MVTQTIQPPLPTTDNMDTLYRVTAYPNDVSGLGKIYKPDECPERLLEAMYAQFAASPLWWDSNAIDVKRGIYANFFLPPAEADNVTLLDGILARRGGVRALDLFSAAIGVAYTLTWRLTAGERTGVDLLILPLADTRDDYVNSADGQIYLTDAYTYLMPLRYNVRILFSGARDEAPIWLRTSFYTRRRIA